MVNSQWSMGSGQGTGGAGAQGAPQNESRQGRFGSTPSAPSTGSGTGLTTAAAGDLFAGFVELGRKLVADCPRGPGGTPDAHGVDGWMLSLLGRDPVLPGMLAKAVSGVASRGWTLYSGRNTAMGVKRMLNGADDGRGWYAFCESVARSYYMRNVGTFVEMQRRFSPEYDIATGAWLGELSQVVALYNVDSTKVRWRPTRSVGTTFGRHGRGGYGQGLGGTPDRDFPITFERRIWGRHDFFHLVANPGDTDRNRHVGESPLYLCMKYLMLMVLISEWETSSLDPGRMDALMLLTGATDEQVGAAFAAMDQAVEEKGDAAKRLGVIANLSEEVTGQLFFLRRRPESLEEFERRIRMIYEVYAMNLGKDITFFFPSSYGSLLGRSGSEIQTIERTAQESNVFHPKFQEALQRYVIPRTAHFEFVDDSVNETEELGRLKELADADAEDGEERGPGGTPDLETSIVQRVLRGLRGYLTPQADARAQPVSWFPAVPSTSQAELGRLGPRGHSTKSSLFNRHIA